jgi:hypothetical protein
MCMISSRWRLAHALLAPGCKWSRYRPRKCALRSVLGAIMGEIQSVVKALYGVRYLHAEPWQCDVRNNRDEKPSGMRLSGWALSWTAGTRRRAAIETVLSVRTHDREQAATPLGYWLLPVHSSFVSTKSVGTVGRKMRGEHKIWSAMMFRTSDSIFNTSEKRFRFSLCLCLQG